MLISKTTQKRIPLVPQAFVTKGKQRLKQHDSDTVFLENGNEFELELFNPTQNKIKAEIELNGKKLSSGIVLRPGERVFLERFLDSPKKFKFETYFVEGDNETVKQSIEKNGNVSVKFYDEWVYVPTTLSWTTTTNPYWINGNTIGNTFTNSSINSTTTSLSFQRSDPKPFRQMKGLSKPLEETGRIEAGSKSDQDFKYDQTTFNPFHSWDSKWVIKPLSTKPIVIEDLVIYCTECGSKRKKDTHKFCPQCGTKF
jgi:hypothetical protein